MDNNVSDYVAVKSMNNCTLFSANNGSWLAALWRGRFSVAIYVKDNNNRLYGAFFMSSWFLLNNNGWQQQQSEAVVTAAQP